MEDININAVKEINDVWATGVHTKRICVLLAYSHHYVETLDHTNIDAVAETFISIVPIDKDAVLHILNGLIITQTRPDRPLYNDNASSILGVNRYIITVLESLETHKDVYISIRQKLRVP